MKIIKEASKYGMSDILALFLKSMMHDLYDGNKNGLTALKKYLCVNRNIPFSENLDIHHINCLHADYRDENLVVIHHSIHSKIHSTCREKVLQEIHDELYEKGLGLIQLNDLDIDNIENKIKDRYLKLVEYETLKYAGELLR